MHARWRRLRFGVVVCLAVGAFASASEDDLVLGTWILNVEKSSYDPGPPPRSQTRTSEKVPEGIKATTITFRGTDENGRR